MKILDVNVLLYAYHERSEHHDAVSRWLLRLLEDDSETIGLPWLSMQAFIRVGTNSRISNPPISLEKATCIVSDWVKRPNVEIPEPSLKYWETFGGLLVATGVTGPMVTDVALAALAIDHNAVLCSVDRDFRRFESHGLKLLDPLADVRHRVQDAFKAALGEQGAYR